MSRRYVNICITPELIAGICFPSLPGAWHRTGVGLPADAKLIRVGYDFEKDQFYLTFEHPAFPETTPGDRLPVFDSVQMTTFCFESPASEKAIAELNRTTAKQIEAEKIAGQQTFSLHQWRVLPDNDLNASPDHVREEKP